MASKKSKNFALEIAKIEPLKHLPYFKHKVTRHRFELIRWFVFHIQIGIAIWFFAHQMSESGNILAYAFEISDLSVVWFHYFNIILLGFIIPYSLLMSVGHWYGWVDDSEKELTEVFVYIAWGMIFVIELIV